MPLSVYLGDLDEGGARAGAGKKLYDKRETEKRKTLDREMRQAISDHG